MASEGEVILSPSNQMRMSPEARHHGIGWVVTAFFIVADMVGGGVVAMPVAFLSAGLMMGVTFMILISTFFAYTAHLLGENWVIMQERWPIYRKNCRKPYTEIALKSMGEKMKVFASIAVYMTLFGTAVVYILLSSKIFEKFLMSNLGLHIPFCYLLCIVSLMIMPLTYLKSPADFWLVVVVAMLCTICAVVLIIIGISIDFPHCFPEVHFPEVNIQNAVLSLGTFLFAFSGHHVFPTIQHDMRKPKDFTKSVVLGFTMVALLYMPLSVVGFVTYGDSMRHSVIDSVQSTIVRQAADVSIAVHCILTLIIMANPLNQQAEHFFKAPQTFGYERVIIRSVLLLTMLLCALTVPDFGPFMNLVGSTTIPAVCVILPSIFNLYLNAQTYDDKKQEYTIPSFHDVVKRTNKVKLAANLIIIVLSIIGGLISAYLSVREITTVHFTPPCYLRPFFNSENVDYDSDVLNCCGANRNIYALGNASEICRL